MKPVRNNIASGGSFLSGCFKPCLARLLFVPLLLLPAIAPCHASEHSAFLSGLSLQGFTGILNTPSAHVTNEGFFQGLYTSQKEEAWRNRTGSQDNFLVSIGALSFAEAGFRLTSSPGAGICDLSGSIKFTTAPLFHQQPLVPVLALGLQDIGGGSKYFRTSYAVASEDIWRIRLSVGVGHGPNRMKGVFGGAELKLQDWLYLLAEYDTKDTNVGARVITPGILNTPVSLTATVKRSLGSSTTATDAAVGFSFPLEFPLRRALPDPVTRDAPPSAGTEVSPVDSPLSAGIPSDKRPGLSVEQGSFSGKAEGGSGLSPMATEARSNLDVRMGELRNRLLSSGFMNVRIGEDRGRTLVVEYENTIFNHNELDALGVVAGISLQLLKDDFVFIRLVIRKKNIRLLQVCFPCAYLSTYLETGRNLDELKRHLVVSDRFDDDSGVVFIPGEDNSGILATSLVLWPGLITFVGTDYGVFDYLLSLKTELFTNLWKGALLNVRGDIPLLWSENLDRGKPYSDYRDTARLERLMLFQGAKLMPGMLLNLGGGLVAPHRYGSINELAWNPGDGVHGFRLTHSWSTQEDVRNRTETYLASYRYYFSPLDLSLRGTAGRFWSEDRGFFLEAKRFFGDTSFAVYYKNSTASDRQKWQAGGITISFPLTPGRDMKHYGKLQLRGTDEWSYSQESVITTKHRNSNDILSFPLATTPVPTASLYNQYLNRDRLSRAYMEKHLFRLRDAWLVYRPGGV